MFSNLYLYSNFLYNLYINIVYSFYSLHDKFVYQTIYTVCGVQLGIVLTCPSCAFTVKSGGKKDGTGQVDEANSTTVTDSQSEQSPSELSEQVNNQEKGETVSEEHTRQGETSDQRTESPSPEIHMDWPCANLFSIMCTFALHARLCTKKLIMNKSV